MEVLISLIALIISIAAFFHSVYTDKTIRDRDRKSETLKAYNRLEEEALLPLDKMMPKQIEKIARDNKSEEYKTVASYVARIEHFCVGVNERIYDQEVVYELAHGFLDKRIVARVDTFLKNRSSPETKGDDYYANLHKVVTEMNDHRSKR